jgi:poly(3-hydroxybutyrate) depolymerase
MLAPRRAVTVLLTILPAVAYGLAMGAVPRAGAPHSALRISRRGQASQVPAAIQPAAAPPAKPGQAVELRLPAAGSEVTIREGLVVAALGTYGRSAVPTDFLAWQLAAGTFKEPHEGDLLGPDDSNRTQTWTRLEAGTDGWMQNRALNGGYFWVVVFSERARTMILDASGYYVARINAEPRGGEKYGTDCVRHPVHLRAGRNTMLFQGERGRLRARLFDPPAPLFFTDNDPTLPDLVIGEAGTRWVGVRLVNATDETIDRIEVSYETAGKTATATIQATVPPLMARKLAIPLALESPAAEGPATVTLWARARAGRRQVATPPCALRLKAVPPSAHHVRTFVSEIDGSVQYYAVAPLVAAGPSPAGVRPALVLSLHGASVEAVNQARAYKSKDWAWIVAPTNRRPYGFDWEDWGRLDAMEVAEDAARLFNTDPARTYLTGHSMGGHGTWQIGATLPDRWAAIAPSAGWHSFSSYGGGPTYKDPTPVEKMLVRANHPGETPALARNMLHYGVYVLHGDKDDNVPVAQARFMRELLAKFHGDFSYYERPGAGHWWGDECVDWPPLFEFLRRHTRQETTAVDHIEFVTANPGISASSNWVTIVEQQHPLEYSRVTIDRDPKTGAVKGTTENVARLAVALAGDRPSWSIDLDGTRLTCDGTTLLQLERDAAGWHVLATPDPARKNPQRAGGFKDAFRHHVVLVYGTLGTADENARAFNKARFDAETFWYRGNGSVDIVPDKAFDADKDPDRNVVVYGNADTNAAWKALLGNTPVEVRNGRARIGDREFAGSDLGGYFIRPRPNSLIASVAAVAWTGASGWIAAGPVQYFISGAGFPDLLLFSTDMLRRGTRGVHAIGWFGNDWSVERGEFAWGQSGARGAPLSERVEAALQGGPRLGPGRGPA